MADEVIKITNQQLTSLFKAMKDELSQDQREGLGPVIVELETLKHVKETSASKADISEIEKKLMAKVQEQAENIKALLDIANKNQPLIDQIGQETRESKKVDFMTSWKNALNTNIFSKDEAAVTKEVNNKNFRMQMDLKVADMTSGGHVTGDVVHSYNSRQGLVPSQNWNFRSILNTTPSPTGSYVTYRETGTTGSISVQTEGQGKTQIDYSFTEVKTVSKYIAGYATFSKQLMYNLPFLNNTLPRMLLRDFYKKENDYIYDTMVAAATGSTTTPVVPGGPTNDVEEILFWIANQRNADFSASYGVIDWADWARIMKSGRNSGSGYAVPMSGVVGSTGDLNIAGTPILGASWADAGEFLLWDNEMVERVETESLRVEFSFEEGNNFTKNLITAKVECFEELNVLRPDAIIHGEFGGS